MKLVKAIVTVAAISLLAIPAMAGSGKGSGSGDGPLLLDLYCATVCELELCEYPGADECPCCVNDCDGIPDPNPASDGDGNQYGERKGGGDGECNDPVE